MEFVSIFIQIWRALKPKEGAPGAPQERKRGPGAPQEHPRSAKKCPGAPQEHPRSANKCPGALQECIYLEIYSGEHLVLSKVLQECFRCLINVKIYSRSAPGAP